MVRTFSWLAIVLSLSAYGCSSSSSAADSSGAPADGDAGQDVALDTPGESGPLCAKTAVACSDQVISQMNLKSQPADGAITNTPEGAGFSTLVDATAGGAFATNPAGYVYARFGDAGLEKVSLSDVDAIDSMDWDIAFRRYVIRVNSGDSGPSCVEAGEVVGVTDFDAVTTAPASAPYIGDTCFTPSPDCKLIPDGSGLPSSPATALSGYWSYPGCVKMTGKVYVVKLASGRDLKLVVTSYYSDAAQTECNTTDAIADPSNDGSGNVRIRWAFLP